jgi:hypothetical protein
MNSLERKQQDMVQYDNKGNVTLVFEKDVHIVANGDFLITANGEVSILSRTALSLDCALMALNCRLTKQIRDMKMELRLQFIDMIGGIPAVSDDQKQYLKVLKNKVTELLSLNDEDTSHLNDAEES